MHHQPIAFYAIVSLQAIVSVILSHATNDILTLYNYEQCSLILATGCMILLGFHIYLYFIAKLGTYDWVLSRRK